MSLNGRIFYLFYNTETHHELLNFQQTLKSVINTEYEIKRICNMCALRPRKHKENGNSKTSGRGYSIRMSYGRKWYRGIIEYAVDTILIYM